MNMIDFAVQHLLTACVGPRYLAGDWNFEPHQIRAWNTDARWIEVQDLWEKQTGSIPKKTCKSKTRKDFLWLSPELARHFVSLSFQDAFADHSVMNATFANTSNIVDRWLWPKPSPIDWSLVPDLPEPVAFVSGDPTDLYLSLWNSRETLAKQVLETKWTPSMAGRAAICAPVYRQGWPSPLKKGRTNDVTPTFHGVSVQHSRWFKQLRRLQNYCRWVSSSRESTEDGLHGALLWKSILNATGFQPSFASWWHGRAYRCPSDVCAIPAFPPTPGVAKGIFDAFQVEVRLLENNLSQARHAAAHHRRAVNPHTIYRDVKRPAALPVETLIESKESKIAAVDPDDHAIELDPPIDLQPDLPVLVSGFPVTIHHAERDKLWLESIPQWSVVQRSSNISM